MLHKLLISLFLLSSLFISSQVNAQTPSPCADQGDVVLDSTHPPVYLSFERVGEHMAHGDQESKQGIWLRLHNNTKWPISILHEGGFYRSVPSKYDTIHRCKGDISGLEDGSEIDPYYHVETTGDKDTLPDVIYGENLFAGYDWLPSGRTAVFSVPREYLVNHLYITIEINYEWEWKWEEGVATHIYDGQQHRIEFYAYQLPDGIVDYSKNRINFGVLNK